MKKLAIMTALAVASLTASAVELSAVTKYDYDRTTHDDITFKRATLGVKADFNQYGALDVSAARGRVSAWGDSDTGNGYDIGYSNGVTIGKLGISARIGASKFDDVRLMSTSLEFTHPITSYAQMFVGIEHLRAKIDHVSGHESANRATVGANFALSNRVALRLGYAHTDFSNSNSNANGLTSALSYKF